MTLEFPDGLTVGRQIGEGYFANVFEGTDNVHGTVAVKVF